MVSGVGRSAARNGVELGRTVERCTAAGAIQHARVRERGVDTIRAPHCKTHLFVAEEEEELVFLERPAYCAAPLLQAAVGFGLIRGIEEIPCVQVLVAEKAVGGAMQVVRSRPQADGYITSGLPAIFGFSVELLIHFLDRIDGQQRRCVSVDSNIVDDILARIRIDTRQPLDGVRVAAFGTKPRSEEHTSELQSRLHLVCRLLLEKKKIMGTALTSRHHIT